MIDIGARKRGRIILKDGRVKWTGRRVTVAYKRKNREIGNPMLVLPVEFTPWIGKLVEVEMLSESEIVVRLEE